MQRGSEARRLLKSLAGQPAVKVEFLAEIAERVPPSRAPRVADLLVRSLPLSAGTRVDVKRTMRIIQRLPLSRAARRQMRHMVADIRPSREGRPPPLRVHGVSGWAARPGARLVAAAWERLSPPARRRFLDTILDLLEAQLPPPSSAVSDGSPALPARPTKAQLIATIAEKARLSAAEAGRVVGAIFDPSNGVIAQVVHGEESLSLPGFGTFRGTAAPARKGRNPRSGMTIDIPARTLVSFIPGKRLNERSSVQRRSGARGGSVGSGQSRRERVTREVLEGLSPGGQPPQESRPIPYVDASDDFNVGFHPGWSSQANTIPRRAAARPVPRMAGGPPPAAAEPPTPPSSAPAARPAPGARPAPAPRPAPRPARQVSNGFSDLDNPARPLAHGRCLEKGAEYAFWLQVGEPVAGSIAEWPVELNLDDVSPGAVIEVVLFPVGTGGFEVMADTGELCLGDDGTVTVARQPGEKQGTPPASELHARRLFFPLRAPSATGEHRLRCNLYHGQTLLQSWLVRAHVAGERSPRRNALRSAADYELSRSLAPSQLAKLTPHRLSVLMNTNGDGTHSLFFKGEQEFRAPSTLDGSMLQDLIGQGRGAMRRAAWGEDAPFEQERHGYMYADGARDLERLRADLQRFALRGFEFYDAVVNSLAQGYDAAAALHALMRRPGLVQVASRRSAAHLIPAALFYDRLALDTGAPDAARFTLCPEFLRGLDEPRPLEEQPCFQGSCPSVDEPLVICPSGFWGFRHDLGMPLSVGTDAPDADEVVEYPMAPGMAVAVWRDFVQRAQHEQALQALRADLIWEYADTREEALTLLGVTRSPVVYFYCHGGMEKNVPYLLVGGKGEGYISRTSFRGKIRWTDPRPLVFINGCQTAAVEPERALNFVSTLIETANASGVIGTEITVFEQLACDFAEEFLRRFLVDGAPVGKAVRGARLALLKRGNPLGLVYIPFALAGLRLVKQGAAPQ